MPVVGSSLVLPPASTTLVAQGKDQKDPVGILIIIPANQQVFFGGEGVDTTGAPIPITPSTTNDFPLAVDLSAADKLYAYSTAGTTLSILKLRQ